MAGPDFDKIIGRTETRKNIRKMQIMYVIMAAVLMLILYATGQFDSGTTTTIPAQYVPKYPDVSDETVKTEYNGLSENPRDLAVYKQALSDVNAAVCSQIFNSIQRSRCEAVILLDQKKCEVIETDIDKMNCFNVVQANVQEKIRCENLPLPVRPENCNVRYDKFYSE